MVPHTMNCVHYNSCNLFNNNHVENMMSCNEVTSGHCNSKNPTCKASCKSHYIFIVLRLTYVVISF